MTFFLLLFLAVVFCGGDHDHAELKFGDAVAYLTDDTFQDYIKDNEYVLSVFYAPWCGHCKKIAPELEKVTPKIHKEYDNVRVGVVDCVANAETCQSFGVGGYPTIKWFKNGKPSNYEGGRSGNDFLTYIQKKTGPSSVTISTVEELEKHKKSAAYSLVIGFFKSKESKNYATFFSIADNNDEFSFVDVIDVSKELQTELDVKSGEEFILALKPLDDEFVRVEFTDDATEVEKKLVVVARPLIDEVSQKTFKRLIEPKLPLCVVFVDTAVDGYKESIKVLLKPAEDLQGKITFGWSNTKEYLPVYERMGGNKDLIPGVGCMDVETRANYLFQGEFNSEEITKWAAGIADGSVGAFLKSDPIPEVNDEPIYIVVGKAFKEEVVESDKDVFLFIHAPWCGHCKKLKPDLELLAKDVVGIKDTLRIAMMDGTTNDAQDPRLQIQGFPTIYFYPKGKAPVRYEGDRTLSDMKQFLIKNAVASKDKIEEVLGGEECEGDTCTKEDSVPDEL